MPEVFTCEYTFKNKRQMLVSLAEDQDTALVQGFRHAVKKMKPSGKPQLHENTLKSHDGPYEAHKAVLEFTAAQKRPAPTPESVAETTAATFEPAKPEVDPNESADE